MGNTITTSFPNIFSGITPVSTSKKRKEAMPIETFFKLPMPLPSWPTGCGFGKGSINLGGGLEVRKVSTFTQVWSALEGGQDNHGATFFTPSPLPSGFSMLGCYAQPNANSLFGWVLVARDVNGAGTGAAAALAKPVDYTLVLSSESLNIKQDSHGYFWLPVSPEGYKPVGHIVTASPEKPSLDEIRCVRSDLTDECEKDEWLWGSNGFDVYNLRPTSRGVQSPGVCVGTFLVNTNTSTTSLSCLKNMEFTTFSSMPNLEQIKAIAQEYSPVIFFHPDEIYLPSSVNWFFSNGALLYKRDDTSSTPSPITPNGSNLPQGGSNDGAYWLNLPAADGDRQRVSKGDLQTSATYMHAKPMFGGTFTDIAIWVFYPFNGPAKAKVGVFNVSLGKIGEHVGDWEHLTLRVSNFDGQLWKVYFSEHSSGEWKYASEVEFKDDGSNKPVAYASLHGHAFYAKPGLVLQGDSKIGIGIRNDTAKGKSMGAAERFEVVAAEYLEEEVAEVEWVNYMREWGPKITYDVGKELRKVERFLPGKLRSALEKVVNGLPAEVLGEEGPTGPKDKSSWTGDEK